MYQSINFTSFVQAFQTMGRYDQFGYDALQALFNHLEDRESDTGESIELDVIALCCDYSVVTLKDINQDHDQAFEDFDDAIEWLNYHTVAIPVDDEHVIIQAF